MANLKTYPIKKYPQIILSGEREPDIHLRFQVAGASDQQLITSDSLDAFIDQASVIPNQHIYILTTYTAMLALRKKLAEQGIIAAGY
jgi:Domain of unknown function (DUF1727).